MSTKDLIYDLRGVSASKDEVHQAIKHLDKGLDVYKRQSSLSRSQGSQTL